MLNPIHTPVCDSVHTSIHLANPYLPTYFYRRMYMPQSPIHPFINLFNKFIHLVDIHILLLKNVHASQKLTTSIHLLKSIHPSSHKFIHPPIWQALTYFYRSIYLKGFILPHLSIHPCIYPSIHSSIQRNCALEL